MTLKDKTSSAGIPAAPADDLTLEQLDARLGPLTVDERRFAGTFGDALDLVESEQGFAATEEQGRLVQLVLLAARHAGGAPLADLVADSGMSARRNRAVSAALRAVAGKTPPTTTR